MTISHASKWPQDAWSRTLEQIKKTSMDLCFCFALYVGIPIGEFEQLPLLQDDNSSGCNTCSGQAHQSSMQEWSSYRNPYIKSQKRQIVLHLFTIFSGILSPQGGCASS